MVGWVRVVTRGEGSVRVTVRSIGATEQGARKQIVHRSPIGPCAGKCLCALIFEELPIRIE